MVGPKYSKEQKEEFFRLLDKGGTVRAAARAVGVHQDAGYNWLRKSGLTMQHAPACARRSRAIAGRSR